MTDACRHVLESLGCVVEEAEPDFAGVGDAFPTLRHLSYHASYSAMAKQRPEWIKDTIHWEIAEADGEAGVVSLALLSSVVAGVVGSTGVDSEGVSVGVVSVGSVGSVGSTGAGPQ